MSVALFFLLAVIVAAILVYPLLPGRMPAEPAPVVTDSDIEQAVRRLRQRRRRSGHAAPGRAVGATAEDRACPTCGQAYQVGDRFCVHCGGALPQADAASAARVCSSCGITVGKQDKFCPRCGQKLAAEEVA